MLIDYSKSLSQDSRNISELLTSDPTLAPMFREAEIAEAVDALDNRQSVLLVGPAQCGKSSIILGIADALNVSGWDVLELSSTAILVGTRYIGDWQSKLRSYVDSANDQEAILNFVDIANLAVVGQAANDTTSGLDLLRAHISNGELVLLGEATPETYRQMQRVNEFVELFHVIRVKPLTGGQVDEIVETKANNWLSQPMDKSGHQHLKLLANNFAPPDIGPGTRLQLLERIDKYLVEQDSIDEGEPITRAFIDTVFSAYSGLPTFVFSQDITVSAAQIRKWFRSRIFGQEQAIEAVVECLTLFKSALRDPNQPIGTFLFTGPTGVGKTELSKALAEYLYGSSQRLLRFDMSEYANYDSFQTLIGQGGGSTSSALLIDPVKAQPFQVILFDEIEKGHSNIFDLLLQLLDEGRMTQPDGKTVDFRNTIIICTTNAGASEMSRPSAGFTHGGNTTLPMHILERYFRPEFLNRFQHVLAFHSLNHSQVRQIAKSEVKNIVKRSGIVSRNLVVDIDDSVIDAIVRHGYSDRYGARALKREVQRRLALPVASYLMENKTPAGSLLTLSTSDGRTLVKGFSSKENTQARHQEKQHKSAVASKSIRSLKAALAELTTELHKLEQAVNITALRQELTLIDQSRDNQDFWQNRHSALQNLKRAESINEKINRLERLGNRAEDLLLAISQSPSRQQVERTETAVLTLEKSIERCALELLTLGDQHDHPALVLLQPVSESSLGRDELYELYYNWSRDTDRNWQLLHEPQTDEEPVLFSVSGSFAYGYLVSEAGLHRHRSASINSATRVTVAPELATDEASPYPALGLQQALKQHGSYGGKIQSMLEIQSIGINLKNDRSIVENRDISADIATSWKHAKTSSDIVRRYDAVPFFVKDFASDTNSGRRDILRGDAFTALLASRAKLLLT